MRRQLASLLLPVVFAVASLQAARKPSLAVPPESAPNLGPIQLEGENFSMDLDGNMEAVGATWRQDRLLVTADRMRYEKKTNVVIARGHVVLTDGEERLLADYLEYHRNDGRFVARDIRLGRYPIYIQGVSAEGTQKEMIVHQAIVSYTDPGRWKPSIKAGTIVYSPGHYLRTVKSLVGVNGAEFVPLGSFRENLDQAFSAQILSADVGYRSAVGGSLHVGIHEPLFDGAAHAGGDVSFYTKRGLMAGPSGTYADPDGSMDWHGFLDSGFINDRGQRATDVLGDPIPNARAFATWQHQQVWEDWTVDGQFNWWRDSDVTRDFRPKEFYPVQTPDNDVEIIHAGEDDFASVFARFKPNNWIDVQERLPELSYELNSAALGGGFYDRGSASAVSLLERPPQGGTTMSDDRLDVFYSIYRPINPTDWFDFTPVAGARVTDYLDTRGALTDGNYLRTLGEFGFDSQMRASGIFDYRNDTWNIDGLRHLITPQLSYRYIPGSTDAAEHVPDIDRQTFSTYLQPLELGDARSIDDLGPRNTLRIGVDNLLQTRNTGYGSRNLVDFDIADDFNFQKTGDEPDFSDVHTELSVTPARWIEIDAANVFDPRTMTLREFDAGMTLRDAEIWDVRIAGDFLRHEDDDYILQYSERINEQYRAVFQLEYGARQHILNFAQIGIVQILSNTWRVEYLLRRNGGPNREGRYGLNMQVEVLRF